MLNSSLRRLTFCYKNCLSSVKIYCNGGLRCSALIYKKSCICPSQELLTVIPKNLCTRTTDVDFDVPEDEYEEFGSIYKKSTKKEAIQRFMKSFECSESEASSILNDYPQLKTLSSKDINHKLQLYDDAGIDMKDVFKNPWLLWYKSYLIEGKCQVLDELGIKNLKSAIPLFGISLKRLKEFKSWSEGVYKEKTKLYYICDKLECDPADVSYAISKHKFIERIPFDRLVTIIDALIDAGVYSEDILRDIWVLRYSKAQVSDRIQRAKEAGIDQFKPWMVRCTEKVFNNTLRRHSEKRTLLGPHHNSAVQYISSRLKVNQHEARLILSRHPQLRGVGAAKLCNTLDFLLGKEQKGYNSPSNEKDLIEGNTMNTSAKFNRVQVWNSIRALCHSLKTMKVRLARLRALGYEPYTPSVLYQSKRKFEEFVKKLEEKAAQEQESNTETLEGADRENFDKNSTISKG